jgi:hypothetical protein
MSCRKGGLSAGRRSHAFLLLRVDLPLVGNEISVATNRRAQPKASARNKVATLRAVGSSGRTVLNTP